MQTLKKEIRDKIIAAAKDEFLKKGFPGSSMQVIAKRAGISVSNIYNYFPSKERIFETVTDGVSRSLKNLVMDLPSYWREHGIGGRRIGEFKELVPSTVFNFMKQYRIEVILVLERGAGTRHAGLKDAIVGSLAENIRANAAGAAGGPCGKGGKPPFLIKVLAMNLIEGLLEIAREYEGDSWAEINITHLMRYHIRGMAEFSP